MRVVTSDKGSVAGGRGTAGGSEKPGDELEMFKRGAEGRSAASERGAAAGLPYGIPSDEEVFGPGLASVRDFGEVGGGQLPAEEVGGMGLPFGIPVGEELARGVEEDSEVQTRQR